MWRGNLILKKNKELEGLNIETLGVKKFYDANISIDWYSQRKDENPTRKSCTKLFQSWRVAKMKNLDGGFLSEKLCR